MTAGLQEYLGARMHSRDEVLTKPCPVPDGPGVYGWWFDTVPASDIDAVGCQHRGGAWLLYAGISPSKPPVNGKPASVQTIRNHYKGNAATSTLRLSLGCLLAAELGLQLRRTGSGTKMHFHTGEAALSEWMAAHARVAWVQHTEPWTLEDELIEVLDLPLNLMGNSENPYHRNLSAARKAAKRVAAGLPIVSNRS
ncbi:GIY-YIG nuclease family protein [Gordonia soli]|uniref:GIY-YIG catalytic domain-containing protein n=1 Tax=Gordonia soli NBRC 108243 TaxID=1223545 RepID=M0QR17_9ACTN|nr:hypothetical protein [Gordonia soli]GAC69852.1 hypothetical protein GS4_28_01000 [Gordonia soli NBRC 108243]